MNKHRDFGFFLRGVGEVYPDIYEKFGPYLEAYFPERDYVSLQEMQETLPPDILKSFMDEISPAIMQKFRELNQPQVVH